ncbi:MAG: energy-coupled thiamine transporter ThiT [Clostridia bacterium]|nr:energy-coupled thiamine transporter ThiT [Clostridia bacterium]
MEKTKNSVYKLTLSAVFVALATVLSLIKVVEMPLGGSVTLLSMLPIVIISVAFGLKWGFGSAFVFALGQLALGLAQVLSWGLTPAMLIGTIVFDYIIAFTVLGIAGIFAKKGYAGVCGGVALAIFLRFVSHFISGYVIFKNLEQFEIFGSLFTNRPILYSLAYNGFYMLPELVITTVAAAIIFRIPAVKKLFA